MKEYNEDYGEWWTGETDNCNIYSALSNNLQKYESIYRTENRLLKLQPSRKKSDPLQEPPASLPIPTRPSHQRINTADPLPSIQQSTHSNQQGMKYRRWLQRDGENMNLLNRGCTKEKESKVRGGVRSQSSQENREERCAVQLREIKFVKRDKKKFKDRCVQLYAQSKGKTKISLWEIDRLNKQCREEKIDLFLKLLRR